MADDLTSHACAIKVFLETPGDRVRRALGGEHMEMWGKWRLWRGHEALCPFPMPGPVSLP